MLSFAFSSALVRARPLRVQPLRFAGPSRPLLQPSALPAPPPTILGPGRPFTLSGARARELKRRGDWSWQDRFPKEWRAAVEKTIAEVPEELPGVTEVATSQPHKSTMDRPDPNNPDREIVQVVFWQDRSATGKKPKIHKAHVDVKGVWSGDWQKEWKLKQKGEKPKKD